MVHSERRQCSLGTTQAAWGARVRMRASSILYYRLGPSFPRYVFPLYFSFHFFCRIMEPREIWSGFIGSLRSVMMKVLSVACIIHHFTLTHEKNWLATEQCRWRSRFLRECALRYCSPAVITHDLFVTLSHRDACGTFRGERDKKNK